MPRYLTKSRFVLAVECETKLFYTGKDEYADHKKNDPFLSALAEGGFQVGEMAKLYFPGGHEIETLEHEQALAQTRKLLEQKSVILYEAAIRYRNLFIRADILIKNGSTLDLIEVKSKSFDGVGPMNMLKRDGTIKSNWVPYLYDVAFQKHVLALAFPEMEIHSYLLLADKNARASVDGLNQRFLIYKENGRSKVRVREGTTRELLGDPILIRIPVDDITVKIYAGTDGARRDLPFADWVRFLAEHYERDRKIRTGLDSKCGKCEFVCTPEEERSGLKSGLKECWQEQAGLKEPEFAEPLAIHLWNSKRKDSFLEQGIYLLRDLDSDLLRPASGGGSSEKPGLSTFERQCLQVEKARSHDPQPYFDAEGLKAEMMKWVYPLHGPRKYLPQHHLQPAPECRPRGGAGPAGAQWLDHYGRSPHQTQHWRLGGRKAEHGGPPRSGQTLLLPPRHRRLELPETSAAGGLKRLLVPAG